MLIRLSLFALASVSGCNCGASRQSEIRHLIGTINDNPHLLRVDATPAGDALVDIGEEAMAAVLELMLEEDVTTRRHAEAVLQRITWRMHGFVPGQGWPEPGEDEWRAFWARLGDLDFEGSREEREKAVRLWREWLRTRER